MEWHWKVFRLLKGSSQELEQGVGHQDHEAAGSWECVPGMGATQAGLAQAKVSVCRRWLELLGGVNSETKM